MKIGICDDDEIMLERIKESIEAFAEGKNVEADIHTYQLAQHLVSENILEPFDVIFLDLEMPQMSGVDAANAIRKYCANQILVFVSSHEEMVFRAIECEPIAFVRKINFDKDLPRALELVYKKYLELNEAFVIETRKAVIKLKIKDIMYMESFGHEIVVHLTNGEQISLASSISKLEKGLYSKGFYRCGNSYLINIRYVYSLEKDHLVMDDKKTIIPISRRKLPETRSRFFEYLKYNSKI